MRIQAYSPLPKQDAFHQSKKKYRAYIGGFGSGKTKCGCWEAIQLSFEYPKNTGVICRKTYLELKDTTMKTFFDECPPELIKKRNRTDHSVTFVNGSEILFRSLDQSEKFKSLEIGFFYIDEASETDEDAYMILSGRLRKQGVGHKCGFITSNPPDENHWIYKRFVEDAGEMDKHELIKAPSSENPYLPEDYVEDLRALFPPEWVARYLDGEFGFLTDGEAVYPDFKLSVHTRPVEYVPGIPVLRTWDFGWRVPAVLWCQMFGTRLHVLAELEGKKELIDDFGKRVVQRGDEMFGEGVRYRDYGDPAGRQKSDKNEKTTIQILNSLGVDVLTKARSLADGLTIIRILLKVRGDGDPGILIHPSCRKLIQAFSGGYRYPKRADVADDCKVPKKDNIYDHLPDALRYLVNNRTEFLVWLRSVKRPPTPRNSFNAARKRALKARK